MVPKAKLTTTSSGDRPTVVVVGLGPAGSRYLTGEVTDLLANEKVVLVRTARHLAAEPLVAKGARALDHHYETAEDFTQVYEGIVEEVIDAAKAHGRVVYAVPGSPLVLETTVEMLRGDERVDTEIHPAMSFLDLCWQRLGIDPVQAHVRVVDATTFAVDAAGDHGPLLIGQLYSRSVASSVKLAVDPEPGEPVVLLRHLGHDDESIEELAWEDIDRSEHLDHLCALYVPTLDAAVGEELMRAVEIIAILRERCPWDKEQTHASLARHLVEETYEALEAIDDLTDPSVHDAPVHLEEELGDVLCQVLFHSKLAAEEGLFNLADVARTLTEKLVRRHPHVFGELTDVHSADDVVSNWERIKQEEKGRDSLMDGIPSALPALTFATKIERKAAGVGLGFDLSAPGTADAPGPFGELERLDEQLVGEALLILARHAASAGIDPEAALRVAARRWKDRFVAAEQAAAEAGKDFSTLSPAERRALFGDDPSS